MPGVPSRIQGSVAVNRLGIGDGRREVIGADRVAATGFEMHWSTRLAVKKVVVSARARPSSATRRASSRCAISSSPRRMGRTALPRVRRVSRAHLLPASMALPPPRREHKASPMEIAVGELVVKNGRVTWRDDMVNPRSALDFAGIDVAVTGASWPVRGPLTVRASAQPPTAVRSASPGASGSIPSQPTSASRARGRDCAPTSPISQSLRGSLGAPTSIWQ